MNPPYSLVCSEGHVLADEIARQPDLVENGALRCAESGCLGKVYSHCTSCDRPLPGYMDGVRTVRSGNVSRAVGRLNTGRGLIPARQWRDDCPYCKSPYPWAPRQLWIAYHDQYLRDLESHSERPLPYLRQAEEAHAAASAEARRRDRDRRSVHRRARLSSLGALLDTWPKRILGVIGVVAAFLALVYGVDSFADLDGDTGVTTSTTTSLAP